MARLTISQKATRVLGFLLGLRSARIAAWLKPYGFDQTALQEGWALLRAVGKTQLDSDPEQPSYDPDTLDVLDKWENKWFTIADATLVRHAPDVHRWFFKNLAQTDGAAVVVGVGTFVERYEKMDKAESNGGVKSGKAAKKKLAERGLGQAVIDEAKGLLETLGGISGPLPSLPDLAADAEQLVQAEKAMWAWYLEWSRIARKVISQRSLLRQLGFLRSSGSGGEEVEIDDEGENEPAANNGSDTAKASGSDADADAAKAKKTQQPA